MAPWKGPQGHSVPTGTKAGVGWTWVQAVWPEGAGLSLGTSCPGGPSHPLSLPHTEPRPRAPWAVGSWGTPAEPHSHCKVGPLPQETAARGRGGHPAQPHLLQQVHS